MTGLNELAPVAIASAFGFGMILAICGSLKECLSQKMEIPQERVAGWLSYGPLILIPLVFLSGLLTDRWGPRGMLVAGSLLAGIGLFGLTFSREVWTTWLGLIAVVAGASALSTGAVVVFPDAYLGYNAASANLGLVFWSLGGLVTGSLVPLILRRLEVRRALSLLAIICLIPAFVATLTSAGAFHFKAAEENPAEIWSSSVFWLVALAFLLYCPLEGSLSTWAVKYLAQLGYSERHAGLLVGSFWLTFVASRLGAAYFEYYHVDGSEPWVIITLACLSAIAIAGLAGTYHRTHAVLWLLLIGLVLGPVFPNLIGILYRHFGEGEMGSAYGAMILIGGAGSLIFPPLMSAYATRTSLRVAFRLPTVISILLAGGCLALALAK